MRLQNRTIIVTGSGRNIGEGIAHTLAGEGARVAVVDIIRERAEAVAGAINATHEDAALPIACDVTNSADVQAMVATVVDAWGDIYALVNNVGVVDRKDILETERGRMGPGYQHLAQERLPRLQVRRAAHGRPG